MGIVDTKFIHVFWNKMSSPLENTGYNIDFYTSNTLNAKLNPISHFLALLGAHPLFHVSRIRVKNK